MTAMIVTITGNEYIRAAGYQSPRNIPIIGPRESVMGNRNHPRIIASGVGTTRSNNQMACVILADITAKAQIIMMISHTQPKAP
jgi:hypothetical protein